MLCSSARRGVTWCWSPRGAGICGTTPCGVPFARSPSHPPTGLGRYAAAMVSRVSHTTVDCHDAYALSSWWKPVLGYTDLPGDPNEAGDEECMIVNPDTGHRLLFIEVPDPQLPAKRIHLDLVPTDRTRDDEVGRLMMMREVDRRPAATGRDRVGGARRSGEQPVLRTAQRHRARSAVTAAVAPDACAPAGGGRQHLASGGVVRRHLARQRRARPRRPAGSTRRAGSRTSCPRRGCGSCVPTHRI